MQTSRLLRGGFWDTAQLVPIRNFITASGKEWTYNFVNGQSFIDIEIEPNKVNTPVGVEEIVLAADRAPERARLEVSPTIYTLGDSTVKSYTFDETPMSGWGQVFDNMFRFEQSECRLTIRWVDVRSRVLIRKAGLTIF